MSESFNTSVPLTWQAFVVKTQLWIYVAGRHGQTRGLLLGTLLICSISAQSTAPPNRQPVMLSPDAFARARDFIKQTARPLEQVLFDFHFAGGSRDVVIAELAKFQNGDGGFASDLESDTRWSGSSPLGTMKALRILNEVGATDKDIHIQAAIRYLLVVFDGKKGLWHALPEAANSAPHASWWNVSKDTGKCEVESPVFPTAAIAGYLQAYSTLLPSGFLEQITKSSLDFLSRSPAQMPMPNIEVLTELVRSLPSQERIHAVPKLQTVLATVVVRDQRKWDSYAVQPLTFVHSPDSPFYADLADAIPANLDYIVSTQRDDGGWGLTWTWEKIDSTAWKSAEKEWRGVVTLENLEKLETFHRVPHLNSKRP